jgi:glycosyltransferase involved in cell wall biosynthesis
VPAGSAPPTLTAVIIAKNEAHQIADCIRALGFASRVLVVDSGSGDGTREIARASGADVEHHDFTDYASQRNFGLSRAATDWTLMIDADERVSPELAAEIVRAIEGAVDESRPAAYRIVRRNHFMGRPLTRSSSGTERITRLMRTARAKYVNKVHETPVIDGEIRDLHAPLEHLTHVHLRDAFAKTLRYATLWAADMNARGARTSLAGIAVHTVHRWVKLYVLKRGFLEGTRGFILAGFESVGVFFKYALLWEMQRRDR